MRATAEQLRSFDRSFEILSAVSEHGPLTTAELAKRTALPRSTLYRLLAGLRQHDLVYLDEGGVVRLGIGVMRLASSVYRQHPLPMLARTALNELSEATDETALLTVVDWPYAICIDRVEPLRRMRIAFEVGARRPLYAGATAKVLLAFMEPREIDAYLRATRLAAFTERTVTDEGELRRQLETIRQQGFCYTEGEVDFGVAAVAVPIIDARGGLVAGISLVGPIGRLQREAVRPFVEAAAGRVQAGLAQSAARAK